MLLDEPSETLGEARFRLFGFPVRVHPLFWLVMALFGIGLIESRDGLGVLQEMLLWTVAAFLSILLHELGHAFVMRRYGFESSITLYGFGGYAS
jgi:Zn-dependent protease